MSLSIEVNDLEDIVNAYLVVIYCSISSSRHFTCTANYMIQIYAFQIFRNNLYWMISWNLLVMPQGKVIIKNCYLFWVIISKRSCPSGHCVVCHSAIYGFWLHLWYLQTLFLRLNYTYISISVWFSVFSPNILGKSNIIDHVLC